MRGYLKKPLLTITEQKSKEALYTLLMQSSPFHFAVMVLAFFPKGMVLEQSVIRN
jgi:hypothetical protein